MGGLMYTGPPPLPFPALTSGQGLRDRQCHPSPPVPSRPVSSRPIPSRPLGDREGPVGRGKARPETGKGEKLGGTDGEGATSGCPLRNDVIRSIFSGGVPHPTNSRYEMGLYIGAGCSRIDRADKGEL